MLIQNISFLVRLITNARGVAWALANTHRAFCIKIHAVFFI